MLPDGINSIPSTQLKIAGAFQGRIAHAQWKFCRRSEGTIPYTGSVLPLLEMMYSSILLTLTTRHTVRERVGEQYASDNWAQVTGPHDPATPAGHHPFLTIQLVNKITIDTCLAYVDWARWIGSLQWLLSTR